MKQMNITIAPQCCFNLNLNGDVKYISYGQFLSIRKETTREERQRAIKNYYYNNWQNDEWTFTLNRETLQGNAESFVGKYGWNFEYKDKWQCEIVEHTNLNLEAEKSIRIENERWQKIKELKKIEEEAQLEKNKI